MRVHTCVLRVNACTHMRAEGYACYTCVLRLTSLQHMRAFRVMRTHMCAEG